MLVYFQLNRSNFYYKYKKKILVRALSEETYLNFNPFHPTNSMYNVSYIFILTTARVVYFHFSYLPSFFRYIVKVL